MKYFLCSLSLILSACFAFSQSTDLYENSKLYTAGYLNISLVDSSRIYKPNTGATDQFHYRPLEIDLWYPAIKSKSNLTIQYGEFLNLLEQRSNRFQNDTVYRGLTAELVQYLSINLKVNDTSKLFHLKTRSYRNADPVQNRFPLILYMCAFNGMSYENSSLFERLASHGYIVACITSVGRYPGNMSTSAADMMEQVGDGTVAIQYLKNWDTIDSSRIGAMGYSWGGLGALLLAMNNPDVKALLSLDGSEMHYYGESKEEDNAFDELRSSPFFQLKNLKIPFAYLESGFKQGEREVDSIYNIFPSLNFQKQYVHFPKATHEDFSCLPSLAYQILGKENNSFDFYREFNEFSLNWFNLYLYKQNNLFSKQLGFIYEKHMGDSLYPVMSPVIKNELILQGRVIDGRDQEGLAYVNVGIPNKNIGTVTRRDGSFLILVNPGLMADSLKISMVGFQSKIFSIASLLKQHQPVGIQLIEKISELKEVVVITKAMPVKTKGNTTTSKFLSIGLPLKFLGSETGIKISMGKYPVLLKRFTFNISENRLDTAVFRMNIYNFKNGAPFENILQQNILLPVGKQTGRYMVNLADYKLQIKGDILLSLEWIEGSSSGTEKGAIFLSAGFLNSATWHRLTSQAQWKRAPGIGVGFNVEVQKLKI